MATATVSFDGTRVIAAENTTGWTADGVGTLAAEVDFKYQGSYSVSAKLTKANVEGGMYYTASTFSLTSPTARVLMIKTIATNKDALVGNAIALRVGSSTTVYIYYNQIYTATTYPILGGWCLIPVDCTISGYRSGATPAALNLGSVVYICNRYNTSNVGKAEHLGSDAIDWVPTGSGLTISGGDGASTDGTFSDFVTYDEGTIANRYGVVSTREGIIYVNGTLRVGNDKATEFVDLNKTVVFNDGRWNTSHAGLKFDLQNASTTVSLTSCNFVGRGSAWGFNASLLPGSGIDTRPDLTVTGTGGTLSITSCNLINFNNITLNSKCTIAGTAFTGCKSIVKGGATITSCSFNSQSTGANDECLVTVSNDLNTLTYCNFTSSGTGHAIKITTSGSYTLTGNYFYSYGASGTSNAAIYNASGGLVTLNIASGDSPTYKNSAGSSTNVVAGITTLTLTGLIPNSEVRIYAYGTTSELAGIENCDSTFQYSYTYVSSTYVDINVLSLTYQMYRLTHYLLPSASTSLPISQVADRQYSP